MIRANDSSRELKGMKDGLRQRPERLPKLSAFPAFLGCLAHPGEIPNIEQHIYAKLIRKVTGNLPSIRVWERPMLSGAILGALTGRWQGGLLILLCAAIGRWK